MSSEELLTDTPRHHPQLLHFWVPRHRGKMKVVDFYMFTRYYVANPESECFLWFLDINTSVCVNPS